MLCYGKYKNKKTEILKFQSNYLMLNIRTIPRNKKKQNSIKQVQHEQRSDFEVEQTEEIVQPSDEINYQLVSRINDI